MATSSPLGKGLSALLTTQVSDLSNSNNDNSEYYKLVDPSLIEKNPYQPRVDMDSNIEDLAKSIKQNGILSPLLVTKLKGNKYRLIAGERRLKASIIAGLKEVPIVIRDTANKELLELAILENIQRQDLNPLEEANAYNNLRAEFKLSTAQISTKIGISVETINSRLNLLKLPDFIQQALFKGDINMAQAEQFFPLLEDLDSMKVALKLCIKNQLSMKQLRLLVDKLAAGLSVSREKKLKDERTREMEIAFTKLIGKKIYFNRTLKGGKIIISFNNDKELDELYQRFSYIGYHI